MSFAYWTRSSLWSSDDECDTLDTPNIFIITVYHHTNSRSWYNCSATQFFGHFTPTDYRVKLWISPVITPALRPPRSHGTIHDVILEHVFICFLHMQRFKGSAHVPRSVRRLSLLWPVRTAAVVQFTGINKSTYTHIYHSAMSVLEIDFNYLKGGMVISWSRS
jgi:hypothetical protein